MKALFIFAALVSALLVAGCQSAESKIAGKWTGPNNMAAFELKADKTFTSGPPLNAGGTWKLADKAVLLETTTIQGKPVKTFLDEGAKAAAKAGAPKALIDTQLKNAEAMFKEMKLAMSDDGKTLTLTDPNSKQTVALTKEEKK
ncbi:MAG TPA: hypothetical protein VK934_03410 [Fimbriimonas sp.]|nr:hypothetical protein [Fimbriimonas sp.]